MQTPETLLSDLFELTFHCKPLNITPLNAAGSGSGRKYFRITSLNGVVVGAYNEDRKENEAFLGFTKHFLSKSFAVPKVYAEDLDKNIYLLEDLGDETLYDFLSSRRNGMVEFSSELLDIYQRALDGLLRIQMEGSRGLDFSLCYPRAAFDEQSIRWDLNYFKYYFLKLAKIPFNEQLLENDFNTLCQYLLEADSQYFLYRDFQSRNIMLKNNDIYFIDYQGGRRGALQYDVASLLYDGKAGIPQTVREELVRYYVKQLASYNAQAAEKFMDYYYAFVFIRIMQAMGSYGFRGFYEKKTHFLQSIPYALNNLKWLIDNVQLKIEIPTLWDLFHKLIDAPNLKQFAQPKLTVSIYSFSFLHQHPQDNSGNGGGYVFDCRCLPNPGRYDEFKKHNGTEPEVIKFLEEKAEIALYFEHVKGITDMAVTNYMQRSFQHLSISFGCTGGQHRSVYFANRLAQYLQAHYDININVTHLMQKEWIK